MTSSNGNIFRVAGPLCGEFTGPGEFPTQRPVTRSFDVFFDLRLNKRLSKQPWGWWFETPSWSLWRQCYGLWRIFRILRSQVGAIPTLLLSSSVLAGVGREHGLLFAVLTLFVVNYLNVYLSIIRGIKRKPHLSAAWHWYHFVAIAILYQPSPQAIAETTVIQYTLAFILFDFHWDTPVSFASALF